MRLHLLGLPHTVTNAEYSHCAFTGKVLRFPSMMKGMGYHITHYGVEGATTEADEQIDVMPRDLQLHLMGHDGKNKSKFYSDDADTGTAVYKLFNKLLRSILMDRVTQSDLVLLPFGHGHHDALDDMPFNLVESGIGYPTLYAAADFKIFESYAWAHFHMGRADRTFRNYEWVIPNYFDLDAWPTSLEQGNRDTVVYFGRITDIKGLPTVVEVATRRPDLQFVLCGQGDPSPYLVRPNIKYLPSISGDARAALLRAALAVIMPTAFIEPFGGVAVESQLVGTPVLSTAFGAFSETIEDEATGFRCHTLGDFLAGLARIPTLDRAYIAERARRLYGLERVGKMYDRAFQQIADLRGAGWYTPRSTFGQALVTATDEATDPWQRAQEAERSWHMLPANRAAEGRKRQHYARQMGIEAEQIRGKKVLDVECGPESLLLSFPEVVGTGLDPIAFGGDDEARYSEAGITRLVMPAEELPIPDEKYDEAWVYNCLQHVRSPEEVLGRLKESACVVRLWEWCNIPADQMHLHVLTADRLRSAMQGWQLVTETAGTWNDTRDSMHGDFYSAVYQRPAA